MNLKDTCTNTESSTWDHSPRVISQLPASRLTTLDASITERQDSFSLLEYTHTLDTGLSPLHTCFSKNHLCTYRKPYTPSRCSTSLLLIKELTSQPPKCRHGACTKCRLVLVECSGLPTFFTTVKQLASQKMLEWTFEHIDTASARWQYLVGWCKFIRKLYML